MAAFEEIAHFGEEAFDLVSKMEEKVKRLKNFVYKVMGKDVAKSKLYKCDMYKNIKKIKFLSFR